MTLALDGLDLCEKVRRSCRAVAERSRQVRIMEERVEEYALRLPLEENAFPEHDAPTHYLGHGADTVAFFLTLDTVNFGSGWFPFLKKREGMSGYFTVASSLADRFLNDGVLDAKTLSVIDVDAVNGLFGQEGGPAETAELMALFARAWRDLGAWLLAHYNGDFTGPVAEAAGSAVRLAELLTDMPFFQDVQPYGDLEVHFYKRAQIFAADLALAFNDEGYGEFHDLDRLTIFADNLVPHVLRHDGILHYDPALAARIDREEPLAAGSPEEVEIRACGVHAVELMAEALRKNGRHIPPRRLDFLLWNRGQLPFYKKGKPRHRSRSVFY